MDEAIEGKHILDALSDFKQPVTMDQLVNHVAECYMKPKSKVKRVVNSTLKGGVQYGYVQKFQDFYYTLNDAVDVIESSDSGEEAEVDDHDEGLEMDAAAASAESGASLTSVEDEEDAPASPASPAGNKNSSLFFALAKDMAARSKGQLVNKNPKRGKQVSITPLVDDAAASPENSSRKVKPKDKPSPKRVVSPTRSVLKKKDDNYDDEDDDDDLDDEDYRPSGTGKLSCSCSDECAACRKHRGRGGRRRRSRSRSRRRRR